MSRIPREVRDKVLERDRYCCALCGRSIQGAQYSLHHRRGRGGAAPHTPENLITLCGSGISGCHGEVHRNPAASYASGFMVRRLGILSPEEVPLVDKAGNGFFLTTDCGRLSVRRA